LLIFRFKMDFAKRQKYGFLAYRVRKKRQNRFLRYGRSNFF